MDNHGLLSLLTVKEPEPVVKNFEPKVLFEEVETRWFRRYYYSYLALNVRIEYGYHYSESGKSYHLQTRYNGKRWVSVKWTYGETHGYNMRRIIRYLTNNMDINYENR